MRPAIKLINFKLKSLNATHKRPRQVLRCLWWLLVSLAAGWSPAVHTPNTQVSTPDSLNITRIAQESMSVYLIHYVIQEHLQILRRVRPLRPGQQNEGSSLEECPQGPPRWRVPLPHGRIAAKDQAINFQVISVNKTFYRTYFLQGNQNIWLDSSTSWRRKEICSPNI